jgi:hypothetical protein
VDSRERKGEMFIHENERMNGQGDMMQFLVIFTIQIYEFK